MYIKEKEKEKNNIPEKIQSFFRSIYIYVVNGKKSERFNRKKISGIQILIIY